MINTPENRETIQEVVYLMRYEDSGEPVTLYFRKRELVAKGNYKIRVRATEFPEEGVNPKFTKNLPLGSVIRFESDNRFLVVEPSRSVANSKLPNSFYVKRIPEADFEKFREEIEKDKKRRREVYVLKTGQMPLAKETIKEMEEMMEQYGIIDYLLL